MEKVKTAVLAHVPANIADQLAQLRIIADVPAFVHTFEQHYLRLRCFTCERGVASHTFDRVARERPGGTLHEATLHGVPSGHYPLIEFSNQSHAIVLPFDFRSWQDHLLHDIRPEWDRQFICARGVSVQEWPVRRDARTLQIVTEFRAPAQAQSLRNIDVSVLQPNSLVRVISTEQYFRWLPDSPLTDDGVLVLKANQSPKIGRFVLDSQPWSPREANLEVEAL